MTTPSVLSAAPKSDKNLHASGLVWDFMRLGFGRRALSLAEFGLLYSTCMILGLLLRESSQRLTIIWPAAGVLAAGEITVDTAPGKGCHVSVVFPDAPVKPLIQQKDRLSASPERRAR